MVTPTAERVRMHTKPEVNERIQRQTERSIGYFEHHPGEIRERLDELNQEWDIERVLEAQFGSFVLFGTTMSLLTKNRWWLIMAAIPAAFMVQHAVQGWCPPVPLWRRAGIRTAREIESERCELEEKLQGR